MEEKLLASKLFKDRKASYKHSVSEPFISDRLTENALFNKINHVKQAFFKNKTYLSDESQNVLVSFNEITKKFS